MGLVAAVAFLKSIEELLEGYTSGFGHDPEVRVILRRIADRESCRNLSNRDLIGFTQPVVDEVLKRLAAAFAYDCSRVMDRIVAARKYRCDEAYIRALERTHDDRVDEMLALSSLMFGRKPNDRCS